MIDSASLLKDLKGRLKLLQADLKARADDATNKWGARLKDEYDAALKRERTGYSWSVWRDNEVDQAAVAWIVSTTFLRFCEDNDLLVGAEIDRKPVAIGWISGPGERIARSEENLNAYFLEHPERNRRHWLQQGFRVLAAQPAGSLLIDPDHNPVWAATISQDAAASLIDFWRTVDVNGALVHDFTDPVLDTRFLGDLYQDLSEHAKKTYALLQTPVFVEEFILDQTLEPAVREFGLDEFKMIDPTCGSGHFLLGAFARLHQKWRAESPSMGPKELVRKAMDSIHGVDLNPFAVAIARFRLTVAGLQAAGETSLVSVAPMGFHLAIGDSLLGEQGGAHAGEFDIFGTHDEPTYEYDGEDLSEYSGILTPGQYHAVVGNPPYIIVKDKALNQKYRDAYSTAVRKYALSVPFMELFFRLAIKGGTGQPAGFTGQITSNSFMKREFGKKLIEEFFGGFHTDNPVDLLQVIDTSGAYIPGHGTPTVIVIGRRRRPQTDTVRAVLGVRGEDSQPKDPANGQVWLEIVQNRNNPGFNGKHVSVANIDRSVFGKFPWSLSGGGADQVKAEIDAAVHTILADAVEDAGFSDITGNDDIFLSESRIPKIFDFENQVHLFVEGVNVRDYAFKSRTRAYLPVSMDGEPLEPPTGIFRRLWRYRAILESSIYFGKTPSERGLRWFDHAIFQPGKHSSGRIISWAFVSTHNHFSFDSDSRLFNKTAPVLKVSAQGDLDNAFSILSILNSSVACFWMHSMCLGKPLQGEEWQRRYEYDTTKISGFPLPEEMSPTRARKLTEMAQLLQDLSPWTVLDRSFDGENRISHALKVAEQETDKIRTRMIFEQEEADWETYRFYGLVDEDLTYKGDGIDQIDLGQRAFEIALARLVEDESEQTSWFERHGSTAITDFPLDWPEEYKYLVQKRLDMIVSNRNIQLLEKPEFKRRWTRESWNSQQQAALQEAILDHLENPVLWQDAQGPGVRTVSELANALRNDTYMQELASAYSGNTEPELADVLHLALSEAVPYLASQRYKPNGLERFREWQKIWNLQRHRDAGENVEIPMPPKYSKLDFQKDEFWKSRGKLDVPNERFISYPDLSKSNDSTPVLGWAGWSYRDQALALARELPGRMALVPELGTDAVVPLLAGLVELEPWLQQWHKDIEPEFGMSPAAMIGQVLDTTLAGLSMTRDQVTAWTSSAPSRVRKSKK